MAFLDDDDEWVESKLMRQVRVLDASDPSVGLVYTWFDYVDAPGGVRRVGGRSAMSGDIMENILGWEMPAPTSAYLVRAKAAREIGGFDETLTIATDREFLLRISMRWHIAVAPNVLMLMHRGHIKSGHSPDALTNLVKYLKAHICRFNRELSERPATLSRVLRNLALTEIRRGNRRASAEAYWRAFRLDPLAV